MKRAGTIREVLLDAEAVQATIRQLAREIGEKVSRERLALVGIQTGGVVLAKRIAQAMVEQGGEAPKLGAVDITLYRDDLAQSTHFPELKSTDILFDLDGREVVLVDDVLYTGRTIRAALDALMDIGRPRAVRLAVLMDRGGRELPIAPDFVGRYAPALPSQSVAVRFAEIGGVDQVALEDLA